MKIKINGVELNSTELVNLHCSPVTAGTPTLTAREIRLLSADLPGWEMHRKHGELHLEKSFNFLDFSHAMAFSFRLGRLADQENHHPAILTEWGKVTVTWWTHKIKGLHLNDFIMAAKTDQLMSEDVVPITVLQLNPSKKR